MAFLVPVLFPSLAAGSAAAIFAGIALNVGGSLLLGAASQALMGPSSGAVSGSANWAGVPVAVRAPVAPRVLVYGQRRVGGTIVYMNVTGKKNQYLHLIIALSSCQVSSIGAIYFGDKRAVTAAGEVKAPWNTLGKEADQLPSDWFELGDSSLLYMDKRLGLPDQPAFVGPPSAWTPNHTMSGVACIYLRLCYAASAFPNGLPDITVDVTGCSEIFDPRTGTTGYSNNAALCTAHYLAHPTFGFGMLYDTPDGLNSASVIEAANICDEEVLTPTGAIEPRYTCNGVVSLSEDPLVTVRELLTSMAGGLATGTGQSFLQAGAYRTPILDLSLNDATGPVEIQTRRSMAEGFNGVRGVFISPENDWQPDDFPAYQSAAYLAEDSGYPRWKDIKLPFTTSASASQRLARIELEKARRQITVKMPSTLGSWQVPAGENITLTHALRGWDHKPFTVVKTELVMTMEKDTVKLETLLTLQETSPLVYSWNATEAAIYAAAPTTLLPSPFDISAPGITALDEGLYEARNGVKTQVVITYSASDAQVSRYAIQGKLADGPWQTIIETPELSATIYDVANGSWQFRVIAYNSLGVGAVSEPKALIVRGLGLPPAALTNVSAQTAGGSVLLKWSLHPDLDVRIGGRIQVRHSPSSGSTWANSVYMLDVAGGQSSTLVSNLPGYYLLRAIDSSGALGPVYSIYNSGAEAVGFLATGTLQEDDDFLGYKSNTIVRQGALCLDDPTLVSSLGLLSSWSSVSRPSNQVAVSGIYEFATSFDFGMLKTVRLRRELLVVNEQVLDSVANRAGNVGSWGLVSGAGGGETSVQVEIAISLVNPPVWEDWRLLERDEVQAWHIKARAVLATEQNTINPLVSVLRIYSDEVA